MPAPSLMDFGSGMDTKGIIKKLMDLEQIPIRRLERKNKMNHIRIAAWGEVRNRTKNLENKSNLLKSFSGSFAINDVKSSDPGAITGQAAPEVHPGKQQIEVVQLATFHALHSNSMARDNRLPEGDFSITVNKKKVDFKFSGGKPKSLLNLLKTRGHTIFEAHNVQLDSDNMMIALRSKFTGKIGEIKFEDKDGFLDKVGFTTSEVVVKKEIVSKKVDLHKKKISEIPLYKNQKDIYALQANDSILKMNKDGRVRWDKKLGKNSVLEFSYVLTKRKDEKKIQKKEDSKQPHKNPLTKNNKAVTVGPVIGVKVGDVSLEGYNIKRKPTAREIEIIKKNQKERKPLKNAPIEPATIRIGVIWNDAGVLKEGHIEKKTGADYNPVDGKVKLSVNTLAGGKEIVGVFFENKDAKSKFSKFIIHDQVTTKTNKPVNESAAAQDAIINVNGVQVSRASNRGLTDIIEGVSLDFNRVTDGPVTVSIETRTDEIIQEITAWVHSYNDLLIFCREITKTKKNTKKTRTEDLSLKKNSAGLFVNNATIRRLVSKIRTTTSGAFPVISNEGFRVLSDVGVTTGKVGQNWEDIKTGKLTIDEKKLKAALISNPEAVRNLFASDTNEDNVKESGVSVALVKLLKPYNRQAGGLVSLQIDMLKDTIKYNKKSMYKQELSLKGKESNLRRKYGRMERAIRQSKSTGNFLKSQNRRGN